MGYFNKISFIEQKFGQSTKCVALPCAKVVADPNCGKSEFFPAIYCVTSMKTFVKNTACHCCLRNVHFAHGTFQHSISVSDSRMVDGGWW